MARRARHRRLLLRTSWLPTGVALGVFLAGPVAAASAAVAALERLSAMSAANSANKSINRSCPAGKKVVGAGGLVGLGSSSADGQVRLDGVVPSSALTDVRSDGVEDENGHAANWEVTAYAICATPPAGLQRVAVTSASTSTNKGVTASCPLGKRLIGTGGETNAGAGQVLLAAIRPNPGLTAVSVFGVEDENGFAGSWSVSAYAICAAPPAGLVRLSASSPPGSNDTGVSADCPVGKRLLGAGGEITGGAGQVVLDSLQPLTGFEPVSVFVRGSEDENSFAGNWSVTAYAICAAASQWVVVPSVSNSAMNRFVQASCPGGTQVTGGGGDITGGLGQVFMNALTPEGAPTPTALTVWGFEDYWGGGFSGAWFVRAYAICATPLPGLQLVSVSSPTDPDGKSATATCSAGKKVVGAGGAVGADGRVIMDAVTPNSALTNVTVHAEVNWFDPAPWYVRAYAICATPPPGLQRIAVTSDPDSDPVTVVASCPSGKNLLGAGGAINGGFGTVAMDDLRPNALLTNVAVTGLEDEQAFTFDWTATAYAICASP